MSTPFRELFVELPRSVFEVLQGVGEVAATRALTIQVTPPAPTPWFAALQSITVSEALCATYGWARYDVRRLADRRETWLTVEHRCGHRGLVEIEEKRLIAAPDAIEEVLRILDENCARGRRCFCVQPPEVS
jgi:hypothetical protein